MLFADSCDAAWFVRQRVGRRRNRSLTVIGGSIASEGNTVTYYWGRMEMTGGSITSVGGAGLEVNDGTVTLYSGTYGGIIGE